MFLKSYSFLTGLLLKLLLLSLPDRARHPLLGLLTLWLLDFLLSKLLLYQSSQFTVSTLVCFVSDLIVVTL